MKTRMGRPKLPAGQSKGKLFAIRLTPAEKHRVKAAAKQAGLKPSVWARLRLLGAPSGEQAA